MKRSGSFASASFLRASRLGLAGLTAALVIAAGFLAAVPADATTVLYVPLERSIELSDVMVVGHVLAKEAEYNAEGELVTRVDILVEEALKGDAEAGSVVSFHAWGGSLDGVRVETVGEASYRLGEKVMVQLESIQGELHTLGLAFGKWEVVRNQAPLGVAGEDAGPVLRRNLADLHLVGATETPVQTLPLAAVRHAVRRQSGELDF